MAEDIRRISLCFNCKNAPDCTYQKDPNKPLLYCEEFEIEELPDRKIPQTPADLGQEKDVLEFKGLCSDCDNRKTCGFPKPEGGIWHCEEYR